MARRPARHSAAASQAGHAERVPVPPTVWACGLTPIDPDTTWPVQLVGKIVRAFSPPGGRVLLLPWPEASVSRPRTWRRTGARCARELASAATAVETVVESVRDLGRSADLVLLDTHPAGPTSLPSSRTAVGRGLGRGAGPGSGSASRPFWADLVGEPDTQAGPDRRPTHVASDQDGEQTGFRADADLIITSYHPRPERADVLEAYRDGVALTAAVRLRVGGVLAVLTHCDWSAGALVDPTGPIVASAQNADLLYLQHIVALHHPVRDGQLAPDSRGPTAAGDGDESGWLVPHRRISSDLLVFAQPRDYQPVPTAPVGAGQTEVSR